MSDMTTQEMIEWSLAMASKCHSAQGVPDIAAQFEAIAARLKVLEEALREFVYLNDYYVDADDAAFRQAMKSAVEEHRAVLDTVREVDDASA